MSDQKIDDSRDLDLNFAVDGEEKAEGYVCGNLATDTEIQVDMNKQGQQGSSLLRVDFRAKNPRSIYSKCHSFPTEYDQDNAMRAKIDYDQDRIQSSSNDSHYQGETDELPGSYFHKSSLEFKAQTLHHERETEDSDHSQESPPTADNNQVQETECNSNVDRSNPILQDEKMKDTLVEKPTSEFTNSPDKEIEVETIRHQTVNLSPCSRSPSGHGESQLKNERCHHSTNSQIESRNLDMMHSFPLSPKSVHKRSTPPLMVNQMLVSPEGSLGIHLSPNGHRPSFPLEEDFPDQLQCPTSRRGKHYLSPERSDWAKRISTHGHLSPSATRTSASSKRSRQVSQQKNGSYLTRMSESPNSCYSPKKYRRHDRSISRSPIQQRVSASGNGRDYRERCHSRSPCIRDHYSSPRRRYSPRRRSPPRYHSYNQSPRRRPWSPPPNRRNGVGKPGKNLFVAGFSFLTTERDLERKFSRFGHVRDARIVRDKRSGDSRGFGFLSLERDEDADAAIRALDETEWNGRVILVEKSKSTP